MIASVPLKSIVNAHAALNRLGQRSGIKAAPAWWIASSIKTLKPHHDTYIERRQLLLETYGAIVGSAGVDGDMWSIKPGNEKPYSDEHRPLIDQLVDVQITKHRLSWIGGDVAKSIEPGILAHLGIVLERDDPPPPSSSVGMSNGDVESALASLAAVSEHRMSEEMAWWFSDHLVQIERLAEAVADERRELLSKLCPVSDGKRTMTADFRRANEALRTRVVNVSVTTRPFSDLGDLIEKIAPATISPIMFLFSDPGGE